jgi:hypothetical protein
MFIYFYRYTFRHLWKAVIWQRKKIDKVILFIPKPLKLYHNNNGLQLESKPQHHWKLYTRTGQLQSTVFVFKPYICFPCLEIVADNVIKHLKDFFFNCSEFVLKSFRKRPCKVVTQNFCLFLKLSLLYFHSFILFMFKRSTVGTQWAMRYRTGHNYRYIVIINST